MGLVFIDKESCKNTFPSNFHLVYSHNLPKNSFYLNGNEYKDIPCVFQVWKKDKKERVKKNKQECKYFTFVKKNENPDFSIRRVGGNAGYIDKKISNKSIESHYFIKLKNIIPQEFINKLLIPCFNEERKNTVGPRSISKQELINEINMI